VARQTTSATSATGRNSASIYWRPRRSSRVVTDLAADGNLNAPVKLVADQPLSDRCFERAVAGPCPAAAPAYDGLTVDMG
jgi:hypothetical protein